MTAQQASPRSGSLPRLPSRAPLDGRALLFAGGEPAGRQRHRADRSGEPDVDTRALPARGLEDGSLLGFDARTVNTALARRLGNKLQRFAGDEEPCRRALARPPAALRCAGVGLGIEYRAKRARTSSRACARWRTRRGRLSRRSTSLRGCWICAERRGLHAGVSRLFLLLTRRMPCSAPAVPQSAKEVKASLAADGVAPCGLSTAPCPALPRGTRVLLDGTTANYRLTQSVPDGAETLDRPSPIIAHEGGQECRGAGEPPPRAHLADGIALTRFLRWLKCDAVRGSH